MIYKPAPWCLCPVGQRLGQPVLCGQGPLPGGLHLAWHRNGARAYQAQHVGEQSSHGEGSLPGAQERKHYCCPNRPLSACIAGQSLSSKGGAVRSCRVASVCSVSVLHECLCSCPHQHSALNGIWGGGSVTGSVSAVLTPSLIPTMPRTAAVALTWLTLLPNPLGCC